MFPFGRRADHPNHPARAGSLVACLLVLAWCCPPAVGAAEGDKGLLLAEGGQAKLPVVISAKASESTKAVAAELAQYLGRIAGAPFEVSAGDGSTGIVLGTIAEFPDPALDKPLELRGPGGSPAALLVPKELAETDGLPLAAPPK